jgi:hypothetical protein
MQAGPRDSRAHDPFLLEVKGAIVFLREHSFLRYQQNTAEYESRRRVAIDALLRAVHQKTGVSLHPVYEAIDIEALREASIVSVRSLLKRTIHTLKRSQPAADKNRPEHGPKRVLHAWEKAARLLQG